LAEQFDGDRTLMASRPAFARVTHFRLVLVVSLRHKMLSARSRFMESPHAIEILLMRVRPIRLRFRERSRGAVLGDAAVFRYSINGEGDDTATITSR